MITFHLLMKPVCPKEFPDLGIMTVTELRQSNPSSSIKPSAIIHYTINSLFIINIGLYGFYTECSTRVLGLTLCIHYM